MFDFKARASPTDFFQFFRPASVYSIVITVRYHAKRLSFPGKQLDYPGKIKSNRVQENCSCNMMFLTKCPAYVCTPMLLQMFSNLTFNYIYFKNSKAGDIFATSFSEPRCRPPVIRLIPGITQISGKGRPYP